MEQVIQKIFNGSVKFAGSSVTIKRYSVPQLTGYQKRVSLAIIKKTDAEKEKEQRDRFEKTNKRAKEQIHDLIACNVSKQDRKDFTGRVQKVKFLTLTFSGEVGDIKQANAEFTAFMKRLSYHCFGEKKNVIKYIAVPELQGRGVWHYHVVLLNCPYVSNKLDNGTRELESIWGNGFVYINALKQSNGRDVDGHFIASYITKYMTKELELVEETREMKIKAGEADKQIYKYENYDNMKLWGMKRYQASKGLNKPQRMIVSMSKERFKELIAIIKGQKHLKSKEYKQLFTKKFKNKDGDEVESSVWINAFIVRVKWLDALKSFVTHLMRETYTYRHVLSKWSVKPLNKKSWSLEEEAEKFMMWIATLDYNESVGGACA